MIISSNHPFRLRVFHDGEAYTIRVYIWNLTHGGGPARPVDEYRIQITGFNKFQPESNGKTLILGWWDEAGVFAGFDYKKHSGPLGSSPSIQIREQYLRDAYGNGFSPCDKGNREIAIAFRPDFFIEYVRSLEDLHDFGNVREDLKVLEDVAKRPLEVNERELDQVTAIRRKAVASVLRSLRDSSFRRRVLTSYEHRCAMCGVQLELVEAAHIVPVGVPDSTDETCNGVCLCALHHCAYDRALVSIDDDYHVIISERRKSELAASSRDGGMEKFVGALRTLIILPPDVKDRPHVRYLRKGREVRDWLA